LVGKPKGTQWEDTYKWEDNNLDLQRLVWKGVEWIYLAHDKINRQALVKRVETSSGIKE
jgi:hypothetical protein